MLKKGLKLFAIVMLSAALIGCGNKKEEKIPDVKEEPKQETVEKDKTEKPDEEHTQKDEEQITDNSGQDQNTPAEPETVIKVYFSNEDATGFSTENVQLASLSADDILKALIGKGAVAADVKIESLTQSQKDGEKVLDIDFSPEFGTYVGSLGTTGEYMTMGSICNTYLEAYGCQKIKITVKGEVLSTGHAEYPGYMGKFK